MNGQSLPDRLASQQPPTLSGVLALAMGISACVVGSAGSLQTAPLALETIGLVLLSIGVVASRRGRQFVGRSLSVAGLAVAMSTFVAALAFGLPTVLLIAFLSCGVGLVALAIGVYFLSGTAARTAVLTGLSLVLAGVLANAVIAEPTVWRSATAVTLVVLTWDVSERAIGLGNEVGTAANTASVELVGAATSALVGFVGIGTAIVAARIPITVSSVFGLALLLVSAVAFLLALSHVPSPSNRQH
ncbi:hypothetical protein HALLA_20955 (plasmid) [Halostagnicola larsenii XH-48]|uniref:Uncharacterized protein n=1 Tax=Halostagnicola larsenii XH-48 TaxID=797299 RepID=W0JUX6_9EURY|nr:hypothetical protein [Halostagnicola larsenii]AHG02376.1 hypothetical protein HALLA_20955 [Halostagnicola larsenii XH-48]